MTNKKKLLILGGILIVLLALYMSIGINNRNFEYAMSKRIPRVLSILITGSAIAL